MSKISIHAYHERIDRLIEESRLAEAVAHCRHILNQYPRHVATYRLLGKTFLEQQRFGNAMDVFQRVLSADPEDFIAHIGLSIAHKAEQLQAQAIWHMERAFEIDPYNAIIQDELKALYAQRDGIAPERLSLTPGALARLHYRSGLYPQAIAAARELLAAAPGRVDLQALLAEALWRDDQRVDAVEVCLDLLETLPNCIKANAILAEVWLLTGRTKEAHDYLQRLQPLTLLDREHTALETPVGSAFNIEGTLPLPDVVLVDELDDAALILEEEAAAVGVDWVGELTRLDGSGDGADTEWFDETPDIDWFKAPKPAPDAAATAVPDWLREISEEAGVDLFAANVEPTAAAGPPELTAADVLSFLEEMEDVDESEPAAGEEVVEPVAAPADADVTFAELGDTESAESGADFANWLDQTLVEHGDGEAAGIVVTPLPVLPPDPEMLANLPDWLREAGTEHAAPSVESLKEPLLAAGLLEELAAMAEQEDEALPAVDAVEPPAAARLVDTRSAGTLAAAVGLPPNDSSDLSTWLDEMVDDLAIETATAEPEFEVREMNENDDPRINQPDMPDEDAPDLAGDVEPLFAAEMDLEAAAAAELDEIPDWLQGDLDSQDAIDALPDWLQPPPSDAYLEDAELPGWLKTPAPSSEREEMPEPLLPTADAADLTWLDEIAAGKGAALEEPLTLRWPNAAPATGAPAEEAVPPDWLDELGQVDWESELTGVPDESADWLAEMAAVDPLAGGDAAAAPSLGDEVDIFADVPEDPEAAMAWLERLAARQGAPLDELPTITEMPPMAAEPTAAPVAETETAAEAPLPVAEWAEADMNIEVQMPAAAAPMMEAEVESAAKPEMGPTAAELAEAEMFAAQIPEDPEAAMAWLEQLAARQGAPLAELPTVSRAASEVISEAAGEPVAEPAPAEWTDEALPAELFAAQIPDDPEAAIAWLEQLAARQGAPLEELPTMADWPEPKAAPPPALITAAVEPAAWGAVLEEAAPTMVEMSEAEAFAAQIPEDPEEAMAWLEKLAARQGAPLEELPTVMGEAEPHELEPAMLAEVTPPAPPAGAAAVAVPDSVLDEEVPDNSAAALAWLVRLALLEEEEEEAAAAPESLAAPAAEMDLDWLVTDLPAAPALPAVEPTSELPTPAGEEAEPAYDWVGLSEQDLAESLPDWLSAETPDGDTSWLDELDEVDLDNWLTAEEQVLEQKTDFVLPPMDTRTAAEIMPPVATLEEVAEVIAGPELIELPAADESDLDRVKLNQARAAVDAGNISEALTLYRSLIEQGAGLSLIVPDLEAASTRHRRQPLLRRLLGDAYMRQGELQKALNIYREVMDHL